MSRDNGGMNITEENLSDDDLERAQYLGALAYLTSYVRRMARTLGVDDSDKEAMHQMVVQMVEPLNHATEAAWRGMMKDRKGMYKALQNLRKEVERLM